jgi:hypothetical protein
MMSYDIQLINADFSFVSSSCNMCFVISIFSLRPVFSVAFRGTRLSYDSMYIFYFKKVMYSA